MAEQADRNDRKVCIGVIAGAHGVSGLVRLKSFTADPEAVAAYGPLTDASGRRRFRIELTGAARDMLLARIEGVTDRTAAEALRGVELHVERGRLPAPEADEFYHTDLIGLPARAVDGSEIGTVTAFYDYGAGDMIEIRAAGGRVDLLPFTKAVVPQVDLERGFVVIDPPSETYARPEDERAEDERAEAGA
jgi:16S rRNA processing protein RimM